MIEVIVVGLGAAAGAGSPLLLVQERNGARVLPIGIGPLEAQAVALPLQGVRPPRPMTHDVFVEVMDRLGAHLQRVEITALIDSTFHARLLLEQAGHEQVIDIRPSDAIALAVRTKTPIFVGEEVMDRAAIVPEWATGSDQPGQTEEASSAEPVDESSLTPFREFIESLDMDDLGQGGQGGQGGPEPRGS